MTSAATLAITATNSAQADARIDAAVAAHVITTEPGVIDGITSYRADLALAADIAAKPRHRGQAATVARIRASASSALAAATYRTSAALLRNFPEKGAQWAAREANKAIDAYLSTLS